MIHWRQSRSALQFLLCNLALILSPFSALLADEHDYPYALAFQTVRTPLLPATESALDAGEVRFRLSAAWANVWSIQDERFIVDGEELRTTATLRYGLGDRLQVGMQMPYIVQGGGTMDSFLEGFHRATGVTQGGRDRFARNTFNVSYEPYGKYYALLDDDPLRTYLRRFTPRPYPRQSAAGPTAPLVGFPFGDIRDPLFLSVRRPLSEEDNGASGKRSGAGGPRLQLIYRLLQGAGDFNGLQAGLIYHMPGSSGALLDSLGAAAGAFLSGGWQLDETLQMQLGLSYTRFSQHEFESLRLPVDQWSLRLRGDYQLRWLGLFAEYVVFTAPVRSDTELGRSGHTLGLGFSLQSGEIHYQAGVAENFLNYGTTPDFGLFFSVERGI
ncbi:MAG: DUF3187 family protein [Leptospirales bacterium]|nr:DUF3187 family protein [Leptospirales bacterium]